MYETGVQGCNARAAGEDERHRNGIRRFVSEVPETEKDATIHAETKIRILTAITRYKQVSFLSDIDGSIETATS